VTPPNNPQLKNARVGQILEENVMDIKIITVASEMTSNISNLTAITSTQSPVFI